MYRVNDLIKALERIKRECGDLPVQIDVGEGHQLDDRDILTVHTSYPANGLIHVSLKPVSKG